MLFWAKTENTYTAKHCSFIPEDVEHVPRKLLKLAWMVVVCWGVGASAPSDRFEIVFW